MPEEKIRCPYCFGTGRMDLPEHLQEVLDYVRDFQPVTSKEVAHNSRLGSPSAALNRLETLRHMGLVTRKAEIVPEGGRRYAYSASEGGK